MAVEGSARDHATLTTKLRGLPEPWHEHVTAEELRDCLFGQEAAWADSEWLPRLARLEAENLLLWQQLAEQVRPMGGGKWQDLGKAVKRWRAAQEAAASAPGAGLRLVDPDSGVCLLEALGYPDAGSSRNAPHRTPADYICNTGGVGVTGSGVFAHAPLVITELLTSARTGETMVTLGWLGRGGTWHHATISRGDMVDGRALVARIGGRADCPVGSPNAKDVVTWLMAYEAANRDAVVHGTYYDRFGWDEGTFVMGGVRSDNRMAHAVGVSGHHTEWVDAAARAVASPMYFVPLLAAVAAVLVTPLRSERFVLDISGPTSRGKSTGLWLAASVWGNPQDLVSSWGNTHNAFPAMSALMGDLPLFLDESMKVQRPETVAYVVHDLIDGTEKKRASVSGALASSQRIGSCALATGEYPLHSFEGVGQGAASRMLSLQGDAAITIDGEVFTGADSDAFKEVFVGSHGHLGYMVKRYLEGLSGDFRAIREIYDDHVVSALDALDERGMYKGDSPRHRVAKKLALCMTAWDVIALAWPEFAKACAGYTGDRMWRFGVLPLMEASGAEDASSKWRKALDEWRAWVEANSGRIWKDGTDVNSAPPGGWIGRWVQFECGRKGVDETLAGMKGKAIMTEVFEEWCQRRQYKHAELRAAWREASVLLCNVDKGRPLWRSQSVGGGVQVAYIALDPRLETH